MKADSDLPREVYQRKLQTISSTLVLVKKKLNTIVIARLVVFVIAILIIFFSYAYSILLSSITFVVAAALFISLVQKHLRLKEQEMEQTFLKRINNEEIAYLDGNLTAFRTGEEFSNPSHAFSLDLDIFGPGSLYQSIDRTGTLSGKELLAIWLAEPLFEPEEIKQRQQAVLELSGKLDWRQNFRARALRKEEKEGWQLEMMEWVQNPIDVVDNALLKAALYFIPLLTLVMLGLFITGQISFLAFLAYFIVVPFGLTGLRIKRINRIHSTLSRMVDLLQQYGHLLVLIETEQWKSTRLKKEQQRLAQSDKTAGERIHRLARLASALDNRLNMIAALVLNGFLLWDLHCVRAIRKWQEKNGANIGQWLEVIATYDALCSLGTFAFNHPDYTLPEVADTENYLMEARELGHPLLMKKERVDNDIRFGEQERLYLVTGANMAGKSTFLRTVGVNLVLAMTGTTVCAQSFRFSPIHLFTGMRTRDSLQKHESYFFAELKRLQEMIQRLRSGESLFIILDEILKGTNSQDQHQGSETLIRQLVQLDAFGLIATHDLELGTLAREFPQRLTNKRFEVEIKADELYFDYKLKDGISQNLNATFLIKKMGIG